MQLALFLKYKGGWNIKLELALEGNALETWLVQVSVIFFVSSPNNYLKLKLLVEWLL